MLLPSGEALIEFVEKWFEEKGIELRCQACHRSCWQPTQYTATPWVHADGQPAGVGGELLFYMILPLYCRHCGFMVFFNAGMMEGLPRYFPAPVPEVGSSGQPM